MASTLKAELRSELGKKSRALRRAGFLPAVLYGYGIKSQSVSVPFKDFEKVYKEAGESTIISLDIDGKQHNVLIHDLTRDPLKGTPLHADFYAVRMDKKIKAKVPLEFKGEPPAVKNFGGILVKIMHEVEVVALPKDLPPHLDVNLSLLTELNARLHVKDLDIPEGAEILANADDTIVIVEPPRTDEELKALEEKAEAQTLEVKTEREEKDELKAKEKAEKGPEDESRKEAG